MRKWFLTLFAAVLFVFPTFASAQQVVGIESIDVNFWPEYDSADMLVINYVMLSSDSGFPAAFDFRIPAGAELHTVAIGASFDVVSDKNVKYETREDGEWIVLSIEATAPAVQVEYYDPSIEKKGTSRSYTYHWLSDYSVANFSVTLQQPFDASKFTSSLPLTDEGAGSNTLKYFTSNVGAVKAGEPFSFDLGYEKASDAFSVSQIQNQVEVQPISPLDDSTPAQISFNNLLPYLIGGAGLLLIIGGVVYYLQSGKDTGAKKSRRRSHKSGDDDGDIYCSQCGTRARGGDRFCRTCGSRIRQSED